MTRDQKGAGEQVCVPHIHLCKFPLTLKFREQDLGKVGVTNYSELCNKEDQLNVGNTVYLC